MFSKPFQPFHGTLSSWMAELLTLIVETDQCYQYDDGIQNRIQSRTTNRQFLYCFQVYIRNWPRHYNVKMSLWYQKFLYLLGSTIMSKEVAQQTPKFKKFVSEIKFFGKRTKNVTKTLRIHELLCKLKSSLVWKF